MSRPSTRNLSETTRRTFAGIVARQTAALAGRERAYTALTKAQERRAKTTVILDGEVDEARRGTRARRRRASRLLRAGPGRRAHRALPPPF